jgi:predicted MFS family arabinose efflux permease
MSISAVSLYFLINRERRIPFPLLPVELLRRPVVWRSDALAACHGATLVSLVTFLPLYMRVTQDASAAETGLMLLPLMFGIGAGSMATGRVVSRTGLTTIFPSIGLMGATAALLVMALWMGVLARTQLGWLLFFCGLFMGTVMGVVQVTVQSAASASSLGSAVASVQLSRSVGAAGGTALVGTILFSTLALSDPDAARVFSAIVEQGRQSVESLPPDRLVSVQAEIVRAFRAAFITITGFAAAGALLAWSIPARRLT